MTQELVPIVVTDDQLALIKRTIAQGATDEELKLFLFDCKRQGVHPLDRLLHFTKRGGRYTPITSIDLMRTRAAETGECAGIDDAIFPADDDGLPKWASVTVYRLTDGKPYPYKATARWREYYPGDAQGIMWRKMPHTMLGKCAEALALRKAFPKQLQGLYAAEEMHQAGPDARPTKSVVGAVVADVGLAQDGSTEDLQLSIEDQERVDQERHNLVTEANRLVLKLKLKEEQKATYRKTYLGGGVDVDILDKSLDIGALKEMVNALRARAGEAKV